MPNEWDVPLFEVPEKYRPPKRQAKWPKWTEYKGKPTSCDECILDLARGHSWFMAEYAQHVREDADGRRYYCSRHAHQRKIADR